MNRTLGLAAIIAALGIWAGVSAWQSPSVQFNVMGGLAILLASVILFGLWVWYRAAPGSGDAMILPTVILGPTLMLVGLLLPRLFWPDAEWLHIAAALAYLIVTIVLVVQLIRRRRVLRRAARPV